MKKKNTTQSCPLPQSKLLELSFMEIRNKTIEIAAFLDRMERSEEKDSEKDFRYIALKKSLQHLTSKKSSRVKEILMQLSDTSSALKETLDTKSAYGAYKKYIQIKTNSKQKKSK